MNAIIFCAGNGKRFQPISFTYPKPLVPIGGVPIVESTLRMLRSSSIERITLIVGYMAEKFEYLQDKYNVELVFNPLYRTHNTHSSLLKVVDRLDGSLLIDGDVTFIKNVLHRVQPGKSQFVTQPTVHGLEWEVFTDEDGRIREVKKWTNTGHSMAGLAYWEGEGARALSQELLNCAQDDYWEEAVLRILARTPVYSTPMEEPFLQETDCIKDALHYGLLSHEEVATLSCVNASPVKLKGITNSNWKIRNHKEEDVCLRIPGYGTDGFINRDEEPLVYGLIEPLQVTPQTTFFPGGLKTTKFMEKHRIADTSDLEPKFFAQLAAALKKINSIEYTADSPLPPMYIETQILKFENLTNKQALAPLRDWIIEKARAFDAEKLVLCHRDLALENILVSGKHGKDLLVIDFEYSGFTHPLWEFASFILESGMPAAAREEFIKACGITGEEERERLLHMEILVDYVWSLWGYERHYFDYSANKFNRMTTKLRAILETGQDK